MDTQTAICRDELPPPVELPPLDVMDSDFIQLDWEQQAAVDDWVLCEQRGYIPAATARHEEDTARALQFAHQIKDGLNEFFICRAPDCAFVGRNTDWAHTLQAGGFKFACPRCGVQYKPFAQNRRLLVCNMVWIVKVTEWIAEKIETCRGARIYEGQNLIIPVWWENGRTARLHDRLKEIFTGTEHDAGDLTGSQRIGAVAAVVRRFAALPAPFRWLRMTDLAVQVLEDRNAQGGAAGNAGPRLFGWQHLQMGFPGFHCPEVADWTVLDEEQMYNLWTSIRSEDIPLASLPASDEDEEM